MTAPHGYGRYTRGCRCEVCRFAKAAYMRTKRISSGRRRRLVQATGEGYHFVPGITHGISGYTDFNCRCPDCCSTKREHDARRGH